MEKQEATILILLTSSGREIICKAEERQGAFACSDVLEILTQYAEDGTMRMGLNKFMPYASDEAGFAVPTATTVVALPGEQLLEQYKRAFSPIVLPEEKKIVLA